MLCILPSWACVVTKGLQNTSLCDPTPQHHAADGVVMPGQDVSLRCLCQAAFSLRFSLFRCNKLGLDRISSAEEPSPEDQVEEATVFVCAQSAPLNQEPIVCADIGTAHSAAVTGEAVCPNSEGGTPALSLSSFCLFPMGTLSRDTLLTVLKLCGAGCSAWRQQRASGVSVCPK